MTRKDSPNTLRKFGPDTREGGPPGPRLVPRPASVYCLRNISAAIVMLAGLIATAADLRDRFGDGAPEFLRLDSESDRRAFRHWFTFLAESQYYRAPRRVPKEINDCAALIRFAYREALREHDGAWASSLDLDAVPNEAPVAKFIWPRTPLGAALFRVRPGPFAASDVSSGAFEQSASKWIVYHTGPLAGAPGEIRRPSVEELLRHPSPRWRPNVGNGNFLGVYRWNILR